MLLWLIFLVGFTLTIVAISLLVKHRVAKALLLISAVIMSLPFWFYLLYIVQVNLSRGSR